MSALTTREARGLQAAPIAKPRRLGTLKRRQLFFERGDCLVKHLSMSWSRGARQVVDRAFPTHLERPPPILARSLFRSRKRAFRPRPGRVFLLCFHGLGFPSACHASILDKPESPVPRVPSESRDPDFPSMINSKPMHTRRGVFWFWLLLVGCAVAGCADRSKQEPAETSAPAKPAASASTPADPDAPAPRPRIVAFGDSLTAGLGLLEQQAYPAILQRRIDEAGYQFEVINAGVSGDTSAGGLRRLDWVLEGDVKVLIVSFGGNDGLRGLPVPQMKDNLSTIIEKARERNVVVILAGMEAPPNFGQEYASAFRQAFRDVALKQRVLFIPFLLNNVAGRPELNQADGIHPNQQGAQIVANTVWAVLEPLLDQLSGAS
jgi:acyl-CoA thioesterase I